MTTEQIALSPRAPLRERARDGGRRPWPAAYARIVLALDVGILAVVVPAAYLGRFGWRAPAVSGVPYPSLALGLFAFWLLALRLTRAYDPKVVGYGAEEYRRVTNGGLGLAALVATTCYLTGLPLARGFVGAAFAIGTFGLLAGRYAARRRLHRRRTTHRDWSHRVLILGGGPPAAELIRRFRSEPYTGFHVVGVCLPDSEAAPVLFDDVPFAGTPAAIREAITRLDADTVAVTASAGLSPAALRRLGWELHASGVDLVVAPALADIAGPRIHTRPVAGLPLIHVEEPELGGPRRVLKAAADCVLALSLTALFAPVLAVIVVAVRLDSRGPAIFRQRRVGRDGREFTMYKFRTMAVDAESRRAALVAANESDGVLFKIRADPRITRAGRFLRRWSLDELPQLLNVVKGEMSLVGPRPPLPDEVARYGEDAVRRLLVPPGMTGLWQVSGRSDLSWEDAVRLDLYYVENWSIAADLTILWKTAGAVLRGRGAY
ncbi:sugar transferase [Actinomadura soli]|uniref:Sugar transferase n=1 Tax=Actinomadura soli TaxID=2508997 RepID=A0A5C4J4K7_9ACTN|nr:sugar transferase [Actinomadura soli]TMQ91784.1 sugar transferase [Actinomadura soli]